MRIPWQAKAFFAIVVWGASFIATKAALRDVGPFTVVTTRFALGIVVLAMAVASRGQMHRIGRREFATFALLGCIGVFVHQFLQVTGLRYTSATNTGWLITLCPVFTALLARAVLHEHLRSHQIVGILLAFGGAFLVTTHGRPSLDLLHVPSSWGDFLVLLSAPNWAVFSVLSKPVLRQRPAALVMTWVLVLGWLLTLPFFVAERGWEALASASPAAMLALLFLGLLCSGVAYVFWYDCLKVAAASRVAAFIYLEPLVTLGVAAWLLHEPITPTMLAGGAIILFGVWLVNRIPPAAGPATAAG